jgi:RNA polymerase sigma-70 factor (ECF subfamily)
MHRTTDRLAAARAGSREALGELLEAYRRYLLRVARDALDPRLAAKGGASDIVQDTFGDAHRDFARFRGDTEAELLAWLRQILVHRVGRFARQYRDTRKRATAREVVLDPADPRLGADPALHAAGPTPSGAVIAGEDQLALAAALARLPDDYRRVILLRHQDGLTFEAAGREMGRSAEAVRKLWVRAIERLNQEMEPGR